KLDNICLQTVFFLFGVYKLGTLISTSGTRFPRAGGSLLGSPAGSPMPRYSRRSLVPFVPINFVLFR
ncbi:hypothetical protein, partial [Peribacillus frigoritolerans]|nr:hypothetical protein [Peribacillus castrilensis]